MTATDQAIERNPGLKFDMPDRLPKTEHFKSRYDPVVEQFTKLMMEDGKLSKAQKVFFTTLFPLVMPCLMINLGHGNCSEPSSHIVPAQD